MQTPDIVMPVHPRTGLTAVYVSPRTGRAYWPIKGGSGEGESTEQGTETEQTDGAEAGTEQGQAPKPAPPAAKSTGKDADDDPKAVISRLERELKEARGEAAKTRTTAKAQAADEAKKQFATEIGKLLGLVEDDSPPDPAKLAAAVAEKDGRIGDLEGALRAKDVELAVHLRAEKHQAKASALLDSRSFLKAVADLDPTAKSFGAALDSAIKDAVKENPSLKATPVAGRSGADLSDGAGETNKPRTTSLSGAIGAHYGT
jgi:hypothetical protein